MTIKSKSYLPADMREDLTAAETIRLELVQSLMGTPAFDDEPHIVGEYLKVLEKYVLGVKS